MSVPSPYATLRAPYLSSSLKPFHHVSSRIIEALHGIPGLRDSSECAPAVPADGDAAPHLSCHVHLYRAIDGSHRTRNARSRGPFKPRNAGKGSSSYQLRQFAEATLGSGSLRKAVKLPEGEDLNEWLAVNGASCAAPPAHPHPSRSHNSKSKRRAHMLSPPQWSIFITRSTFSTAPSPSSARPTHVRR